MELGEMTASQLAAAIHGLGTAMAQEFMDERDIDLCYEVAARLDKLAARVAELEAKLAGCQDHTERQAAMCFEQARQLG